MLQQPSRSRLIYSGSKQRIDKSLNHSIFLLNADKNGANQPVDLLSAFDIRSPNST